MGSKVREAYPGLKSSQSPEAGVHVGKEGPQDSSHVGRVPMTWLRALSRRGQEGPLTGPWRSRTLLAMEGAAGGIEGGGETSSIPRLPPG